MKSLEHKVIVYDSNCKVCSSMRDVILKLTSIPRSKVQAYGELNDELVTRVDADTFRNVMAVVDTRGEETIYGAEGVAYVFSSQYKLVDILLRFKPFLVLFNFLYKVVANNRYIIATPKSSFKCDCLPDRDVRYRMAYIAIAVMVSIVLTALFGVSLHKLVGGVSAGEAATQMLLIAGTGWVLQIIVATVVMGDKALDYVGHLGSIMVTGLLVLVPWMLLHAIAGINEPLFPAFSVVVSSAFMLYLHVQRVRYLEISQGWTISWFLFLQCTAASWIWLFDLT